MNHTPSKWIPSALALGLAITPALAVNPNYAPGDLVLFFQQAGGGSTIYANLGNAATNFRGGASGPDVPNKVNFLDLSAELSSAFGAGWATDPTVYAGLAAVADTSPDGTTPVNGDPPRTLYVSKPRAAVGSVGLANSTAWSIATNTLMSGGASGIEAQNNKLKTLYTTAVAVSPVGDSTIDEQNPFITSPGIRIQGSAFNSTFSGGVQQQGSTGNFGTFGAAGTVHFALDLNRILATTGIAGQVDGVLRKGSYEGTMTVSSSGKVSFITQPSYAPGDLVLFFQQANGANTVYAGLGSAATIFRGTAAGPDIPNKVNFLDLGATLTSAFGAGWASDPTIYAGLAAVADTSPDGTTPVNGDPPRTLYVSKPRTAVGIVGSANSAAWNIATNTLMSGGASGIEAQNNKLVTLYSGNSVVVSPVGDSTIDEQNPFITSPGIRIQASAFNSTFSGGVQQQGTAGDFGTFGAAGVVHFALDLNRILATTGITGQVAGTLHKGSFEGTLTVNSSGQVSFIGSSFDNWMSQFPSITTAALKLPGADPDGDGANNLEEFAFGGDPSNAADQGPRLVKTVDANNDGQGDLTLTLEVRSGGTGGVSFTPAGNQLTATVDGITYQIQGSTDLVNWNSQVSEVTPALGSGSPKSGYVFKTFRLNAGNGLAGNGFIRGFVSQ